MMRTALLILSLVTLSYAGDVAQCVKDIDASAVDIVDAAKEIRSHEYLQAIEHIVQLAITVEDERTVCEGVTKEEIVKYIMENLPADIKQCMSDAAGLFLDAKTIKQDLDAKEYVKALELVPQVIVDAGHTVEDCEEL